MIICYCSIPCLSRLDGTRRFHKGQKVTTVEKADKVSYEQFRDEWLAEIEDAQQSSLQKGRWFAAKLITEWLDVTTDDEDFVVCDGSGDGGIDVAYLKRADTDTGNRDESSKRATSGLGTEQVRDRICRYRHDFAGRQQSHHDPER